MTECPLPPHSRVWAYLRVSSEDQAERGTPIAGQRAALVEYCRKNHLILPRTFIDEARPGSTIVGRNEFESLIHLAHHDPRPVEGIIFWSWARFARDQHDAHFFKADLRRLGYTLISLTDEIPAGEFEYIFEAFIHWKDERRRQEISEGARRGQQLLARMGYVPSGARPPKGYKVAFEEAVIEGRKKRVRRWVKDEELWPVVRRAWEMKLEGASHRRILEETHLYKSPGCLTTFFGNPIYAGRLYFGGTLIEVEPVVTQAEWNQVQLARAKFAHATTSVRYHPRRRSSRFLLSGLLKCVRCGSAMCGDSTPERDLPDGHRQEWRFYICSRRKNRRECDAPVIGAGPMERAVLDCVSSQILSPANLRARLEELNRALDAERPALEGRLDVARRELARTERRIEQLVDAVERAGWSEALQERLGERERQRVQLKGNIADMEASLSQREIAVSDEELQEFCRDLGQALATGPPQEGRQLLSSFVSEIRAQRGKAVLRYRFPFGLASWR